MTTGSIRWRLALVRVMAVLCSGLLWSVPGHAQSTQRIAAIVNDEVISAYDLEQRMRLVLSSSGLTPTPEVLSRIQPEVLRSLVDERLQLQEAKRQDITVDEVEVNDALTAIASQNNMDRAQIEAMLKRSNVNAQTLKDQLRADIAWSKLVQRRFGGRINISDQDISAELTRVQQSLAEPQYLVSEIMLRVEQPEDDAEVQNTTQRLFEQLQAGAPFHAVAAQFSQAATAAAGGDLGWISKDQLDPVLSDALERLRPGQISRPVRTVAGYHIIFLRNRRDKTGEEGATIVKRVSLKSLMAPLARNATKADADKAATRVMAAVGKLNGCANVDAIAKADGGLISADLGSFKIDELAPTLRPAILPLNIGQSTPPFRTATGMQVMIVCDREAETTKTPYTPPTREDVENRLYNQQISMMARRYLRDLRRDAVVEYR